MDEMENKMENIQTAADVDPGISPQSTSKLISSKAVSIPRADLLNYFLQATGMTLENYIKQQAQGVITEAAMKVIGKAVKPKVFGMIQLMIDVIGICDAINTAMTTVKLGNAIYDVYNRNGRLLRVTTNNYEWLSGSGNHSSYYSEIKYATVM